MVRTDVLIFFVNLVIIIRKMKHYTVIQLQESPLLSPPPPRLQLLDLKITISEIIQLAKLSPAALRLQHQQQQQQQQRQQQYRLKRQVKAWGKELIVHIKLELSNLFPSELKNTAVTVSDLSSITNSPVLLLVLSISLGFNLLAGAQAVWTLLPDQRVDSFVTQFTKSKQASKFAGAFDSLEGEEDEVD